MPICPQCSSPFELVRRGQRLYCSAQCRDDATIAKQAAWRQAHPGYQAAKALQWRQDNADKVAKRNALRRGWAF
jgi:hypothetical protein